MARRIAFVVNASTGEELSGGRQDAARMYSILTRSDLGGCEPSSPSPLVPCQDRETFNRALLSFLKEWRREDQLIFYYSGHGMVKNGKYVLRFGADELLPFESVMNDLEAHGVVRAILIVDACQSGEILAPGRKGAATELLPPKEAFPRGMAFITSCRDKEASYELSDGSASVFTTLLAHAIETGLDGRPTPDGRIGVEDAIDYINEKMQSEEFGVFPQTPAFGIHEADRSIWLSRNRTAETKTEDASLVPGASLHTLDELRLLYENTAPNSRPTPGCTTDHLDWNLVRRFAERSETDITDDPEAAARALGLYSQVASAALTRAAVLCFAHHPHHFVAQARSVFIVGDTTGKALNRTDVLGPLSHQIATLVDLVEGYVRRHGLVAQDTSRFMFAVREAVSNAVVHRDYSLPGHVRVQLNFPEVKIASPGSLPLGLRWDALMDSEPSSSPTDPAVAWYLTALQAAETIGRGFDVYRDYKRRFGDEALVGIESREGARLTVTIRYIAETSPAHTTEGAGVTNTSPADGPEPVDGLELDELEPGGAPSHGGSSTLEGVQDTVNDRDFGDADRTLTDAPAATPAASDHPTELAGCTIVRLIGEGAASAVYLAHEPTLDRQVAIKTLFQRFGSPTQRERFEREARTAARLTHPGIVPIYRVGQEQDYFFIVMRYVEGRTLADRIAEGAVGDVSEAVRIAAQIGDALDYAHNLGVLHRDMKPGNVLMDEDGNPYLTDFGIAKLLEPEPQDRELTMPGTFLGSPTYVSPEQVEGRPLDARSDIYALGVMLYEMLSGRSPFADMSITRLIAAKLSEPAPTLDGVDPELSVICARAMARDPAHRFETAEEMAQALATYLARRQESGRGGSPSAGEGTGGPPKEWRAAKSDSLWRRFFRR